MTFEQPTPFPQVGGRTQRRVDCTLFESRNLRVSGLIMHRAQYIRRWMEFELGEETLLVEDPGS